MPTPASYIPPAFDHPIDLDLSLNESSDLAADIAAEIAASPRCGDLLRRYPSPEPLRVALAEHLRVDKAHVLPTTGGDDAIDRIIRRAVIHGPTTSRAVLMHTPTFTMIHHAIVNAGGAPRTIPWFDEPFPREAFLDALPGCSLVVLVTPNNPTGRVIPREDLLAIADAAAVHGVTCLVDLAYIEFADQDPTPDLLARDHVITIRTLSKAWGLAGLRAGYALGSPRLIESTRAMGGPFPISGLGVAIAEQAVRTREPAMRANVEAVRRHRHRLLAALNALGLTCPETHANFALPRVGDAARWFTAFTSRGIGVRRFNDAALAEHLRITVPVSPNDTDRLIAALTAIARETTA